MEILGAATSDALALESLIAYDSLADVTGASPALEARLASSLTADIPAVAPEINRWLGEARAFVTESLKRTATPVVNPNETTTRPPETIAPPPGTIVPSRPPGNDVVDDFRDEIAYSEHVQRPLTTADAEAIVAAIRAKLVDQLVTGTGTVELEIRLRDATTAR